DRDLLRTGGKRDEPLPTGAIPDADAYRSASECTDDVRVQGGANHRRGSSHRRIVETRGRDAEQCQGAAECPPEPTTTTTGEPARHHGQLLCLTLARRPAARCRPARNPVAVEVARHLAPAHFGR